jgi:protein phosphatase
MRTFSTTHVGRVRHDNEDALHVDESLQLFIVADGMGGHAAGDVAARLCVEAVAHAFAALSHLGCADRLVNAVHLANAAVCRAGQENPHLSGMGTTVVAAALEDGVVHVVHVGDSRAYLSVDHQGHKRSLYKLTRDHSYVEQLVQAGETEAAQYETIQHVLTQCVGHERRVHPTIISHAVHPGDRLLLCTDGLWNELSGAELHKRLMDNEPAEALRDAALANGGHDNITCIVAEV